MKILKFLLENIIVKLFYDKYIIIFTIINFFHKKVPQKLFFLVPKFYSSQKIFSQFWFPTNFVERGTHGTRNADTIV